MAEWLFDFELPPLKDLKRPNTGCSNRFHFSSVSDVFMRSSSLIQALLLWRFLQWHNAGLYSLHFDVAPCYWKSLCKISRAQNSWRYESIVLTNRIAGKQMNIKKIKLYLNIMNMNIHYINSLLISQFRQQISFLSFLLDLRFKMVKIQFSIINIWIGMGLDTNYTNSL